jgi:hypothetical protein
MNILFKNVANSLRSLFGKTKKIVNLPQGKEFESWLGV